ncbi:hypothetical protein NEA10_10025 [Phormidium yuhuli AB48]|uniref:Uncharacterized protein n=1 Tax=Phormidium yuhuli AB48 TaxID=2940671 RepID=A0ABY5AXJ4_9CYAN|nr:hypothetical protein [Phormidium yuhuli]USR93026.1 hypothetical protein NEA10_10025 [Phormidium yuhuli AB48]
MAILETWVGLTGLVLFNGTVCLVLPRVLSLNWGQAWSHYMEQPSPGSKSSETTVDVDEGVASLLNS